MKLEWVLENDEDRAIYKLGDLGHVECYRFGSPDAYVGRQRIGHFKSVEAAKAAVEAELLRNGEAISSA